MASMHSTKLQMFWWIYPGSALVLGALFVPPTAHVAEIEHNLPDPGVTKLTSQDD